MFKKVRLLKVTDCTKNILQVGETYEVLSEKRDEFCIAVNPCVRVYVWKGDVEIVDE